MGRKISQHGSGHIGAGYRSVGGLIVKEAMKLPKYNVGYLKILPDAEQLALEPKQKFLDVSTTSQMLTQICTLGAVCIFPTEQNVAQVC